MLNPCGRLALCRLGPVQTFMPVQLLKIKRETPTSYADPSGQLRSPDITWNPCLGSRWTLLQRQIAKGPEHSGCHSLLLTTDQVTRPIQSARELTRELMWRAQLSLPLLWECIAGVALTGLLKTS